MKNIFAAIVSDLDNVMGDGETMETVLIACTFPTKELRDEFLALESGMYAFIREHAEHCNQIEGESTLADHRKIAMIWLTSLMENDSTLDLRFEEVKVNTYTVQHEDNLALIHVTPELKKAIRPGYYRPAR